MDYMMSQPDNAFDLAIVDPEYGIKLKGPCGRFKKTGGLQSVNGRPPNAEYFDELMRVSVHQVIWGGNFFDLPPCQAYLIWDKQQPPGLTFADSEFAWTSLPGQNRMFRKRPQLPKGQRIHPTQKPVQLYVWILDKYAEKGQRILDTHMGSASSAIAAHACGCDYVGCEIDPEYYRRAKERFDSVTEQQALLLG
jgi:site-specific DNA-methyltransferase (adenine-specific)